MLVRILQELDCQLVITEGLYFLAYRSLGCQQWLQRGDFSDVLKGKTSKNIGVIPKCEEKISIYF